MEDANVQVAWKERLCDGVGDVWKGIERGVWCAMGCCGCVGCRRWMSIGRSSAVIGYG